MDEYMEIDIKLIRPDPNQPRKLFDAQSIAELANSICQVGLINPLLVRKDDKGCILVAGERRWRACLMLGMEKVPCIICGHDDVNAALASFIENVQRKDLNPFEQALAMRRIISTFNLTQSQLAERIGKSQSAVANKLRLLSLNGKAQEIIVREKLTERHARELTRLPQEKQPAAALHISKYGLNVAQTEKYVSRLLTPSVKRERIYVFKDIRLFTNTIDRSVHYLKKAGVNASAEKHEDESTIRYLITIPKRVI